MQSMTPSPLRHWLLSPAERLIEEYRSKAPMLPSGIDHHSIELKMAVRILMLQKKLKAAEASLREAESWLLC